MAKRIAIVLSQRTSASPAQRDLEGAIVAELLMVHGLEVTLITDLTTLREDDTGVLCLEGITGELVMLSWISSGDAHQHLIERGIQGRLARTAIGQDVPAAEPAGNGSSRAIYHIDLRTIREAKDCCAEIQRIRDEATVQVIGLDLLGATLPKPSEVQRSAEVKSQSKDSLPPAPGPRAPGHSPLNPPSPSQRELDDDDPELDELMEQFDAWDV